MVNATKLKAVSTTGVLSLHRQSMACSTDVAQLLSGTGVDAVTCTNVAERAETALTLDLQPVSHTTSRSGCIVRRTAIVNRIAQQLKEQ